MQRVHTKIYLDTRQKKVNKLYPVKLRITHQRRQKYYNLGADLSKEEWEKVNSSNPRLRLKDLNVKLISKEEKARSIIDSLEVFTFDRFEHKWFGTEKFVTTDVFQCYDLYIENLEREDRIGTAISVKNSRQSLKMYANKFHSGRLSILNVTPELLRAYEKWFLGQGKSVASVGIYLRALRTIVNFYIKKSKDRTYDYPFGKGLYVIPTGKNIKKALTIDDIKKIAQYESDNTKAIWARDFWLMSYLMNGSNVKDMICLKNKNVEESYIYFIRKKTVNSSRQDPRIIRINRDLKLNKLLSKYASFDPKNPEHYIFPILKHGDNEVAIKKKAAQTSQNVNKYMKRIGTELGIGLTITTYAARHSYATILKRAGAPMELIQENIGHSDLRTTQRYLDSFEDEIKIEFQSKLLDF